MQVAFETSELAYVLHSLGAQHVIGLDHSTFFPEDEQARRSLLAEGFSALQRNARLIPEGKTFYTNPHMMLLAAVLAAPERVLVMERIVSQGVQVFTYSFAVEHIVEQFQAENGAYILTQLADMDAVLERLRAAFLIPTDNGVGKDVEVDASWLERRVRKASPEGPGHRDASLASGPAWAQRLVQLQPRGRLLTMSDLSSTPQTQDILLAQDDQGQLWAIWQSAADKFRLAPLNRARLAQLLEPFLAG